ncbi:hypothetical protein [Deinococcus peraridilitoris]|uniref:Uncharacterized protein n=1 Tax=Deinococcus peraridilitoris (strain DSM 19664 / LMG 22246 / CIP 109416 / KR-200) TaxID=937777 RepID=L0A1K6_DEIPD|nr:hypothetical protein [Deinococcus peraridilitoris]AFZ67057.1 hypothetical protein Deipe_1516 [Deinococcus peraridilitoris DSM 19664]
MNEALAYVELTTLLLAFALGASTTLIWLFRRENAFKISGLLSALMVVGLAVWLPGMGMALLVLAGGVALHLLLITLVTLRQRPRRLRKHQTTRRESA